MAASQLKAYTGTLTYPTYTRQPKRTLPSLFNEGTPAIYPVLRDDLLDGPKQLVDYAAIYLENEHLKLTILPDQGGKIWSVYDKNAQDEVIYVPDVIRPSLIAANGAWIPGGFEYNFPVGHHAATMAPVPCAIVENTPERVAVLTEIHHPHSGLRLHALVSLCAGEARFDIQYVAWNPTSTPKRWGFWCNVGTFAHDGWQFFSKAKLWTTGSMLHDYPIDETGCDTSWWKNRLISGDSFMMGNLDHYFGYYDHTRRLGLAHISADKSMHGMKYHTWGRVLRNYWPEVCFTEDNRNYTEIQSGRHETQGDFDILQPGQSDRFSETWMPYRETGGIEWMNRDVVFQVRDGKPCVFCAVRADVALRVNGRRVQKSIVAGGVATFPQAVAIGARLELSINGEKVFASAYPYVGTQERGARARIQALRRDQPPIEPRTAREFLAAARRQVELDQIETAIRRYRAAVRLAPKDHGAMLELAGCLWRIGAFDEGAALLQKLLKTPLRAVAQTRLAMRERTEEEFFGATAHLPTGTERDVAKAERFAGYNNADAARPLLARALRASPSHVRANVIMAALALKTKDPKTAVRCLQTALKVQPGDRDLILELANAYNEAGQFAATVKLVDTAPKAVRELSAVKKLLAKALFETGADKRCHELMTRNRLFNWEAELWPLDIYLNATLALCENALTRGATKEALQFARTAHAKLPPTLGYEWKHMSHARREFWLGKALLAAGQKTKALAAFRAGFEKTIREKNARIAGSEYWMTDEDLYLTLLCAQKLNDPQALRTARELVDLVLEKRRVYNLATGTKLLRGLVAEFDGKFDVAAKMITMAIASSAETRIARMHLAAVKQARRRGDD